MAVDFIAGAAQVDVSPRNSQFLYGYPHVPRMSEGIHDPLLASALYLSDGARQAFLVSCDVVYISKAISARVRPRIVAATGNPAAGISVSCTHTHSGPLTTECVICDADPVVPPPDPQYLQLLEDGIVEAARRAFLSAQKAQAGLAHADSTGIGANRHLPQGGPSDHQMPVLMVRSADGKKNIACMLVCSMHPTVLHENSRLVSGDFPGLSRIWLQENVLGTGCPVLHQTGPAGNQSPRYVTSENTFAEAQRLGELLGRAVAKVLPEIQYRSDLPIHCATAEVDLPRRKLPSEDQAAANLKKAADQLQRLRRTGAPRQEVRTLECDWFGAEETVALAKALAGGRLEAFYLATLPAEIMRIGVGPWDFIFWPGEIFVEYALALKLVRKHTYLITCANGDAQSYLATREAREQDWYERSNAIFEPGAGELLLAKTLELLSMDLR
ncbi:MAG: neutral/alkaline non-lysosomal ceramidase N-terminal domain-containing protein [Pirellulales bacterium]|nr:neutral/alkaline non-lysosomal ceramidase N-terminal domain-containing protein [Pirellulales bacterium]